MGNATAIADLDAAVRLRSAAYAEEAAARDALGDAQRHIKSAEHTIQWDDERDAVLSASLRGRAAIARIRVEEAAERLREARRDLQRARDLSAPKTVKGTL